ncbi:MAG: tetratricopeptide repeat protein, partial [Pseudomonadota bacterium]
VVAGYRGWIAYRSDLAQDASLLYAAVEDAVGSADRATVLEKGKELVSDFKSTPYAALAALALAKVKVDTGELEDAAGHLDWVINNADQEGIRHVARLRLARVYLATQKPDLALALVSGTDAGSFAADYDEVRGDIYAQQGKQAEARKAYELALDGSQLNPQRREFIEMKLHDLPAVQPATSAQ